jgi:hypothetical protein
MKYIEELKNGDTFTHLNIPYILGIDFKQDQSRLGISLINGSPKWFNADSIVNKISIYTLDNQNNILPIREEKNEYSV